MKEFRKRYKRISENHSAAIKETYYIKREEKEPNLYEDADFSINVIKNSIKDGELQTNKVIQSINTKGL